MIYLNDIRGLAEDCIKMGILICIVAIMLYVIGYLLIYKKILKGEKTLSALRSCYIAILVSYVLGILIVTCLYRHGAYLRKISPLFWSYREAWIRGNITDFRNIVLNIVMFIPLGILLPIGIKKFRVWWKTYLAGFCFSLFIESIQFIFGIGTAEADDLFGNTLGTIIGFGIFVEVCFAFKMIVKKVENETKEIIRFVIFSIPVLATLTAMAVAYSIYIHQGIGYSKYECIEKIDAKLINAKASYELSENCVEMDVYKAPILNRDEAYNKGKNIIEKLGGEVDEGRNDYYDETLFMASKSQILVSVDYYGGVYDIYYPLAEFDGNHYDMWDETEASNDEKVDVTGYEKEKVIEDLKEINVDVPVQAQFTNSGDRNYYFKADSIVLDDKMLFGNIRCEYNEYGEIRYVENKLVETHKDKKYKTISEKEAFKKIENGEFVYDEYDYYNDNLDIEVKSSKIKYGMDSMGYYQPEYLFYCRINGENSEIVIPAIEK
jgi:glycopeptide antibiotics resistance protein